MPDGLPDPWFGSILAYAGYQNAITHYRESLSINPDQPGPLSNLAWIFATHRMADVRNSDEAIRLSEQACQLTEREDPRLLDTRAAAYASAGRFDKAIADMVQAIRLVGADTEESVRQQYQQRLTLYRNRRPYLETGSEKQQTSSEAP